MPSGAPNYRLGRRYAVAELNATWIVEYGVASLLPVGVIGSTDMTFASLSAVVGNGSTYIVLGSLNSAPPEVEDDDADDEDEVSVSEEEPSGVESSDEPFSEGEVSDDEFSEDEFSPDDSPGVELPHACPGGDTQILYPPIKFVHLPSMYGFHVLSARTDTPVSCEILVHPSPTGTV